MPNDRESAIARARALRTPVDGGAQISDVRSGSATERGPLSRPKIADLLSAAGFGPNFISHDRAFLSRWAWADGTTTVATVWSHEIVDSDSTMYAVYRPVDEPVKGTKLAKWKEHRRILVEAIGHPIRVILQTKYTTNVGPNSALAQFRSLDPAPWFCVQQGLDLVLTRGSVKLAAPLVKDTPWTDEELKESVRAYLQMAGDMDNGEPVVKERYYAALSERHGRSPGSYEYRMRNISYVFSLLGRPWVSGLLPAKNVGAKTVAKIEAFIAEVEGKPCGGIATFEAEVKQARSGLKSMPGGSKNPQATNVTVVQYSRDPAIKAWVLAQAKGICECCEQPAPFLGANGPFLEVHHVRQLANRGSDTASNAVAICPNCHRRLHYGMDAAPLIAQLYEKIGRLVRETKEGV